MIDIQALVDILREDGHSLVIANGEEIRTFNRRGVADLFDLVENDISFLNGAIVADKVVGKGAAALMALGGVKHLHTDVISVHALEVLNRAGIKTEYITLADNIMNRDRTGFCPVETLCRDISEPKEMLPLIREFINNMKSQK
jgi:iron complex outermembrane receptor protein